MKLLSSLYAKLESKHFLTNKALQIMIEGIFDVNELNTQFLLQNLNLNNIIFDKDLIKKNLFFKAHNKTNGKLRNRYTRNKYYKKYLNFVEANPITLSDGSVFYYVSILDTLKMLWKNENFKIYFIFPKINEKNKEGNTIISDIRDSECVIKNIFFQTFETIKLIIFQDAFEICNPLGSSKKKHKIVGIYMTFANLPAWHRSQVEEIQLVALIYEKDLKKMDFRTP